MAAGDPERAERRSAFPTGSLHHREFIRQVGNQIDPDWTGTQHRRLAAQPANDRIRANGRRRSDRSLFSASPIEHRPNLCFYRSVSRRRTLRPRGPDPAAAARAARPVTSGLPVGYDPEALAPLWRRHLEWALPDPSKRLFVQRLTGYLLVGDTSERFLSWGAGGNGKTVITATWHWLLGAYAQVLPIASLMENTRRGGSEASPEMADLAGARGIRRRNQPGRAARHRPHQCADRRRNDQGAASEPRIFRSAAEL